MSEAVGGAWSGLGGCFVVLFILFMGASSVEPPTLLLPNLLPHPLPDMFVELIDTENNPDGTWCLEFKKPNDNLAGRK